MARDVVINIKARDTASSVFTKTQRRVITFSAAINTMKIGAQAARKVLSSIVGTLQELITEFGKAGDQLDKMSRRTGVSVEALSELKFAAEQSGSSIESFERAIRGMQRQLFEAARGSTEIKFAFEQLRIPLSEIQSLSPEDQFTAIADALSKEEDASKRAAIAMKVFGRAGTEMIPVLENGEAGIRELREELVRLGGQMSTQQSLIAADYTDAINEMKTAIGGLRNAFGSELAPAITTATRALTQFVALLPQLTKAGLFGLEKSPFGQFAPGIRAVSQFARAGLKANAPRPPTETTDVMKTIFGAVNRNILRDVQTAGEVLFETFKKTATEGLIPTFIKTRFMQELPPGDQSALGSRTTPELAGVESRLLTRGPAEGIPEKIVRADNSRKQEAKKREQQLDKQIEGIYEQIRLTSQSFQDALRFVHVSR